MLRLFFINFLSYVNSTFIVYKTKFYLLLDIFLKGSVNSSGNLISLKLIKKKKIFKFIFFLKKKGVLFFLKFFFFFKVNSRYKFTSLNNSDLFFLVFFFKKEYGFYLLNSNKNPNFYNKFKTNVLCNVSGVSNNLTLSKKKNVKFDLNFSKGNKSSIFFFLRNNYFYNKGKYSRNRQTCRVCFYFSLWFTIFFLFFSYFYFLNIYFNFFFYGYFFIYLIFFFFFYKFIRKYLLKGTFTSYISNFFINNIFYRFLKNFL